MVFGDRCLSGPVCTGEPGRGVEQAAEVANYLVRNGRPEERIAIGLAEPQMAKYRCLSPQVKREPQHLVYLMWIGCSSRQSLLFGLRKTLERRIGVVFRPFSQHLRSRNPCGAAFLKGKLLRSSYEPHRPCDKRSDRPSGGGGSGFSVCLLAGDANVGKAGGVVDGVEDWGATPRACRASRALPPIC